jgi:branched-chain amino acid transport system permease protein
MQAFLQQAFSGLAVGSIYAAVALALVMIFKATHHVNFAQGELAMFSTYIAAILIDAGVPYWAAFLLSIAFAFTTGIIIQRTLINWFKDASTLTAVTVFIGLLLIVNSFASELFSPVQRQFPSPFPGDTWYSSKYLSSHEVGVVAITLIVLGIVFAFFRFTKLGLAMRASAENPESSRLVGIRVGWMLALGWGMAGALGAVAGMMAAPIINLDPNMLDPVLLYAFAAALLGGIDNPWGAPIGGFILGIVENVAGAYVVGPQLKQALALGLIIVVLLFKPSGLFGRTVVVRV